MKLLFLIKEFRQGWGGAPESVRMIARNLKKASFSCDVHVHGGIFENIEELETLPAPGARPAPFRPESITRYDAVCQAGPWQNFSATWSLIRKLRADQPYFYLPRGGLFAEEFTGPRGWKKIPYYPLFERKFIERADGIIFSSRLEEEGATRLECGSTKHHVIPDFFEPLPQPAIDESALQERATFGFLAEIRPMKGLLPLAEAFLSWAKSRQIEDRVRFVAAGGTRPGSEGYRQKIRSLFERSGAIEMSLTGALPHDQRPRFYGGTDIFVAPSRYESFCFTLLEALSVGCSVLSAPRLGVLEQLPRHYSITVLNGLEKAQLLDGLDRAFAAHCEDPQPHQKKRAWAIQTIQAMNHRALEGWTSLLTGSNSGNEAKYASSRHGARLVYEEDIRQG